MRFTFSLDLALLCFALLCFALLCGGCCVGQVMGGLFDVDEWNGMDRSRAGDGDGSTAGTEYYCIYCTYYTLGRSKSRMDHSTMYIIKKTHRRLVHVPLPLSGLTAASMNKAETPACIRPSNSSYLISRHCG